MKRTRVVWSVAILIVMIGVIAAAQWIGRSDLPPAGSGYAVAIEDGITPATSGARAAAIARHYLDEQTKDLAAPNLHVDPVVSRVSAVTATDALRIEPRIPNDPVAAMPNRIVWVAEVSGDFLNLHDLPWSTNGTPWPNGTIVIDDDTGAILGVYPHAPGS